MTAVEWLEQQISIACKIDKTFNPLPDEWYKQAKEMEKQQIEKAYTEGNILDVYDATETIGKQYYNETYGSKGSDETLKENHIVDTNEMVCYTKQDVIDAIIKIHEIYSLHGQYNDTLEAKKLRLKGVSWHIQNILESLNKKTPTSSQTEISDENAYTNGYLHGYNAAIAELPKEISDEEIEDKCRNTAIGFAEWILESDHLIWSTSKLELYEMYREQLKKK